MEEVKEAIQCNICNEINDIGTHYCKKCGRNLNDKIEFTDVLFGISKLMKWGGIFTALMYLGSEILGIVFFPFLLFMRDNLLNLLIGNPFLSISVSLLALSYLLKQYALKLFKKNINLE